MGDELPVPSSAAAGSRGHLVRRPSSRWPGLRAAWALARRDSGLRWGLFLVGGTLLMPSAGLGLGAYLGWQIGGSNGMLVGAAVNLAAVVGMGLLLVRPWRMHRRVRVYERLRARYAGDPSVRRR